MMRNPYLSPHHPPSPRENIFCQKQMTVRRKSVSHVIIFMPIYLQGFTVQGNKFINFGFNQLQCIY